MPVDICGFLEISSLDAADLDQEYSWMSCLNLSSLGLQMGDECAILFGESKYTSTPPNMLDEWLPIAKRRSLPINLGSETAQAVQEALQNDNTVMSTWGFTCISYEEIAQIDWSSYPSADIDLQESYGWGLLFKLMKILDDVSKYQRLIVWFEWR